MLYLSSAQVPEVATIGVQLLPETSKQSHRRRRDILYTLLIHAIPDQLLISKCNAVHKTYVQYTRMRAKPHKYFPRRRT